MVKIGARFAAEGGIGLKVPEFDRRGYRAAVRFDRGGNRAAVEPGAAQGEGARLAAGAASGEGANSSLTSGSLTTIF